MNSSRAAWIELDILCVESAQLRVSVLLAHIVARQHLLCPGRAAGAKGCVIKSINRKPKKKGGPVGLFFCIFS
jgi:hypothetical protein